MRAGAVARVRSCVVVTFVFFWPPPKKTAARLEAAQITPNARTVWAGGGKERPRHAAPQPGRPVPARGAGADGRVFDVRPRRLPCRGVERPDAGVRVHPRPDQSGQKGGRPGACDAAKKRRPGRLRARRPSDLSPAQRRACTPSITASTSTKKTRTSNPRASRIRCETTCALSLKAPNPTRNPARNPTTTPTSNTSTSTECP